MSSAEALAQVMAQLPMSVNRYLWLDSYIWRNFAPAVPDAFDRNLTAVMVLLSFNLVACSIALAGKFYFGVYWLFRRVQTHNGAIWSRNAAIFWCFLNIAYCIIGIVTVVWTKKVFVHGDRGAFLVWDNLYNWVWVPLWIGTFELVHATCIAATLVPSPIIPQVGRVFPKIVNIIGISVPVLWIFTTLPFYYISHKHTAEAYDMFREVSAGLNSAAALGTGAPVPTLQPTFLATLEAMSHHRDQRIHFHQIGEAIRAIWQIILLCFLSVGGTVYLDSLRKQIWSVLPDLRERTSLWGNANLSKASSMQRKRISNMILQYRLMLLEIVGVIAISITYGILIAYAAVRQRAVSTDGSVLNIVISALFYTYACPSPVVFSFLAYRSWINANPASSSSVTSAAVAEISQLPSFNSHSQPAYTHNVSLQIKVPVPTYEMKNHIETLESKAEHSPSLCSV